MERDCYIRLALCLLTLGTLVFDMMSLKVILKTKRTPKNTRFLSAGLIIIDCLSLVTILLRFFLQNEGFRSETLFLEYLFISAACLTVTIMCIERTFLCAFPMLYMKHFGRKKVRKMAIAVWTLFPAIFLVVRYGICNGIERPAQEQEKCAFNLRLTMKTILCLNVVIWYVCFVKTARAIRQKQGMISKYPRKDVTRRTVGPEVTQREEESPMDCGNMNTEETTQTEALVQRVRSTNSSVIYEKNRNTYLVFAYLITMTVLFISVVVVGCILVNSPFIEKMSSMTIVLSAIVDPCLYVFWFAESKLEVMRMLVLFCPALKAKTEKMRLRIFDIVISEAVSRSDIITTM